jgi:hypothetical protein
MLGQWTTIGISILAQPEGTDEGILGDQFFRPVNFDTSFHATARVAALRDRYPDRFLIGTDPVPASASAYFRVFEVWLPVVRQLKPETESQYLRPTMNASSTKGASASASGRRRLCGNYTTTTRREHAR